MDSIRNADANAQAVAARARSLVAGYLETVPLLPAEPHFLDRIERLTVLIALWGARTNLTAKPEDPDEIAFHIIDSLAPILMSANEDHLRDAFASGRRVLDLGSGAGFPGLVLAAASPAHFTLAEARRKRASFLTIAAEDMGLKNVAVDPSSLPRQSTPERLSLTGRGRRAPRVGRGSASLDDFDVVTARAFAAPAVFHQIAAPALLPGGLAILFANPSQDLALLDADKNGLHRLRPIAYTIPRGSRSVGRILGLWQRR
jgi:16S rRNA (guanine527-N7)-methyltransferase